MATKPRPLGNKMIAHREVITKNTLDILLESRRLRLKACSGRLTSVEIETAMLRMEVKATAAIRALEKMGAEVDVT